MKIFARLEEIDGEQILAEIIPQDGDLLILRYRRDNLDAHILTHEGPFPNDDEGWKLATAKLENANLMVLAAEMDRELQPHLN